MGDEEILVVWGDLDQSGALAASLVVGGIPRLVQFLLQVIEVPVQVEHKHGVDLVSDSRYKGEPLVAGYESRQLVVGPVYSRPVDVILGLAVQVSLDPLLVLVDESRHPPAVLGEVLTVLQHRVGDVVLEDGLREDSLQVAGRVGLDRRLEAVSRLDLQESPSEEDFIRRRSVSFD